MTDFLIDKECEQAESLGTLDAISAVRQAVADGTVRAIREAAGVTQADMAHTVGCQPSAVAQWEAGRRLPSGVRAIRYAEGLAVCLRAVENG